MKKIIKLIIKFLKKFFLNKNKVINNNVNIDKPETKKNLELHLRPYEYKKNNRKLTAARKKNKIICKIQSIAIFKNNQFIGYKYIYHK